MMDFFLKLYEIITNSTIANIVTIFAGCITIIGCIAYVAKKLFSFLYILKYSEIKTGIYKGYWIDQKNKIVNFEVLQLKRTLNGYSLNPIYIHKDEYHNYTLKIHPLPEDIQLFKGWWKNKIRSKRFGPSLFKFMNDTLEGRWLGPYGENKVIDGVNGGPWIIKYYQEGNNNLYIRGQRNHKIYRTILDVAYLIKCHYNCLLKKDGGLIKKIIQNHEEHSNESINKLGVTLNFADNSFIPSLGKISIPFLHQCKEIIKKQSRVLDLGTGSGFYAIYLIKKLNCSVVGVDIDNALKENARQNARNNKIKNENIDFRVCDSKELFSRIEVKEKFDYIIGNLPFTKKEHIIASKKSSYYKNFEGSRNLLENLIFGAQFHAKASTKLIFSYANSGDEAYLRDLIAVSSWEIDNIVHPKGVKISDDIFKIYILKLCDFAVEASKKQ